MGAKRSKPVITADRHVLYEASVQSTGFELDLLTRVFRSKRGRPLRFLREDFCGTAVLAVEWIERAAGNLAIGVDLHQPTLAWSMKHHVPRLGAEAHRLRLICDNVLHVHDPKVDMIVAFNYSYQVFKTREQMRAYFRNAHESLTEDGIFMVDVFGGTDAVGTLVEERKIRNGVHPDGTKVAPFTYIWEQALYNPVDHHLICKIHFRLGDGREIRNAFRYDWRLWTLPELQELMIEAGFRSTEVYMDGWTDGEKEPDNVYRRRTSFENIAGWLGYVVGLR